MMDKAVSETEKSIFLVFPVSFLRRKKYRKAAGGAYPEWYRSGYNGPDSKFFEELAVYSA